MDRENQTLEFYNRNADAFVSGTLSADMSDTRDVRPGREEEKWINLLAEREKG